MKPATLECPLCKATAQNTSKERGRFLRRHPAVHGTPQDTAERIKVAKQLSRGIRSVDADVETEFEGRQV